MKLVNVGWIVLHTAATPYRSIDISSEAIDDYHKSKGWSGIGYHFVIRVNGDVEEGRAITQMGAHVEGFNSRSIGICLSGNGDISAPTPEQWKSAVRMTVEMLDYFDLTEKFKANPMRVIGHREINELIKAGVTNATKTTKSCPGRKVDMTKFRLAVLAEL